MKESLLIFVTNVMNKYQRFVTFLRLGSSRFQSLTCRIKHCRNMIEDSIGSVMILDDTAVNPADISYHVKEIITLERRLGNWFRKQSRRQILEEQNEARVALASLVRSQRYTNSEVQARAHAERAKLRGQAALPEMVEKLEKKDSCSNALRRFLCQDFLDASLSNLGDQRLVSDCVTS